jgi:uncharacterized protein (TIGR03067 family)
MQRIMCVLAVLSTPLLSAAGDDDTKKELKALEGKWKAVTLEAGGAVLPKESIPEFIFIVAADGKSTGQMAKVEYKSSIAVDPKNIPRTIDHVHETGAHKGKKQYGIYKLDGDKWTVCMTPPGAAEGDRPKSFDTKDTANVVFVFERVKEDKKK